MLYHISTMGPQLIKMPKMHKMHNCLNREVPVQRVENESFKNSSPVNLPDILKPLNKTIKTTKRKKQRGEREYNKYLHPCVSPRHLNYFKEKQSATKNPVQRGENESSKNISTLWISPTWIFNPTPRNTTIIEGRTTTHNIILPLCNCHKALLHYIRCDQKMAFTSIFTFINLSKSSISSKFTNHKWRKTTKMCQKTVKKGGCQFRP